MKYFFVIIAAITLLSAPLKAQDNGILGTITDESNLPLEFASIALLKPIDSFMISFAVSNEKGKFKINDAPNGDFVLQIYLTGFYPFYKNISLTNQNIDLKTVVLKTNIQQLNEVTITSVVPIQIKQDTVAYNANSFRVHHDDNIEDLLNKLPGIEVGIDGVVEAQGNEITKIYVDGKEFFSGDPAIVLKNMSADDIKQIQVVNKKSDEAELTGIDDNEKNYIINLELKKHKKRKQFGKASVGFGVKGKYFSNLNYNNFTPKTQFAVIGKLNNINVSGSNIQDFLKFTGGLASDTDDPEEAKVMPKRGISGELVTGVGGVNVGYELKKKETVNVDYFYSYLDNVGSSFSKRTNFSRLWNYESESIDDRNTNDKNHKINFNYENKSSNIQRLIVKGSFSMINRNSNSSRNTLNFDEDNVAKSNLLSDYISENKSKKSMIKAYYYRKLNKNKRNFSIGFNYYGNDSDRIHEQDNTSINLNSGNDNLTYTTKTQDININTFSASINYTEPLSSKHFLKLQSYSIFQNSDENVNQYKIKNSSDESYFIYEIDSKEQKLYTSLLYNYYSPKLNIITGVQHLNLSRKFGIVDGERFNYKLDYLLPKFSLKYNPKIGKDIYVNYRTLIRSPRSYENSPILNDLNPSYIRQGNPDLEPEKNSILNIKTTLNDFSKAFTFYAKFDYQQVTNAIIPTLEIDDNYIRTRSYENHGNRDKVSLNFNLNKRLKSLGIRLNLDSNGLYKTGNSIIDNVLNDVTTKEYGFGLSFENNRKNKYDLKIGADFSKNYTEFSIIEDLNRDFIEQHYFVKFDYDITKKLNANAQFDFFMFSDSSFHSNQEIPYLNASISYALTKNNRAIVKLILIDILDQEIDIRRRSTLNFFEETVNKMLGRYIVLSFSYRLKYQKKSRK